MARVILCTTQPAKTSYIFPNTKIEVFSYEELCYYIYNNIALVSEEHVGTPFIQWIRNELGLADLADMLVQIREKTGTDLTDILTAILTYREYYSIDEVKEFILLRERMKTLPYERTRKLQADGFLRYHKYIKALSIYDEILEKNPDMNDIKLKASIYHNRAVAYANNFELAPALDSYMKSYELTGNRKSLKEYLLLLATMKDKKEIEKVADSYDAKDMVEEIYYAISDAQQDVAGSMDYHRLEKAVFHHEKNNLTDFSKQLDVVIESLKSEFRSQME